MQEGLIYTNDSCIGCNKCVRICSSFGASMSMSGPQKSSIRINASRCIVCGACIDVCAHGAREYHDDTAAFFDDLSAGKSISVLVAPSFAAKYPRSYRKILGALKRMGVQKVIPVSLGADICTWAYLKHLKDDGRQSMISTSCPVVVSYIEHWIPSLLPRLLPVLSPLMCLATYCREQLGMTESFAFIGPCIGKSLEVQRHPNLVQYNVTFPKLMEHLQGKLSDEDGEFDSFEYGLGSYYPAPGGLADNVKWLLGDDTSVRVVSGKQYLYERFEQGKRGIFSHDLPYVLIDALNCQEGCIEGTARVHGDDEDLGLAQINQIRAGSKSNEADSPWNPSLPPTERLERLNQQFADLDPASYAETFTDKSATCTVLYPNAAEADKIYESLHKPDEKSRQINCSACGYESCAEMMVAIFNGFNSRYNCVYFEKEETARLARMSFADQLTGVMNRNALEMTGGDLYGRGHSLGLIVVDVNGLKHENDTKGHTAGDRLIVETARALSNRFGRERVFRTGGDEFLVILQDYHVEEIEDGMRAVKDYLKTLDVSVAMGLSYCDSYEDDYDVMLKIADAHMYEDKAHYYEEYSTSIKRREH